MLQRDIDRLNNLSDQLEKIYRPLNTARHTSPINRLEEEMKLLTAWEGRQPYNPQFRYMPPPDGWAAELERFLSTFTPDNQWERYLYDDARYTQVVLHSVESREPAQITSLTAELYGYVDRTLLESAYRLLDQATAIETTDETISAQDAAIFLRQALEQAELTEWAVVVEERMTAKMSVRGVEQKVNIQADALFNQHQLNRLLVHEIGTHVFRYMNGTVNSLRMLRMGLLDYQITEEGLATYHEHRYGLSDPATLRRYALRVVAAHLGLNHSFHEVFAHLLQYTDVKTAFSIVTRAKRGMEDTGEHGVHIKDKVYFEGLQKVSDHLATNPDDYKLLMCGKVALHMLPALRELKEAGFVAEPRYLPAQLVRDLAL